MKFWLSVIALVVAVPQAAVAQELWRGANLGDTEATVRSTFPSVQNVTSEMGSSTWLLQNIRVAEKPAKVYFLFANDKLWDVTVEIETPAGASEDNWRLTETVKALLTKKYGASLPCRSEGAAGWRSEACDWTYGDVIITLLYGDYPDQAPSLKIYYERKPDGFDQNL